MNKASKKIDNEPMFDTAESIKQYGVLVPAIAKPRDEGGYKLVSGHRRKRACELAELETMPVIVRNLDDDAAIIIIIMVDSNLQRENILPSERAFAYKMKLDAVKNQGARNDLTSRQVVGKLETADEEVGCDSVEEIREMILKNLEYEYIKNNHNRERLDEIVDLMVETLCSTKDTINVAGDDYPARLVKEKLLRINYLYIEYVFECLDKTTTYIRNIKRYLLATLFNAPSTIDSYYSALVNHDLHSNP